ncbi:MAG: CoA transferase subunit A [Geminicoccaceae bacterium]
MTDLDRLSALIPDGASLALAPDYSGCALEVVRRLIQRGVKRLHLIGVPQLGFQADLLIGAGAVDSVEAAAVTLGEAGPAPCFTRAVKAGRLVIKDSTCPVIHAGLQAAEKGIPFMPIRGVLGSDLLTHRPDWNVIDNPFGRSQHGGEDPILLVPAIRPDVALFHAALADRDGNIWIGVRRELMMMAHAAKQTVVTVEKVADCNLLDNDRDAAGTIPGLYIGAVEEMKKGAKPLGLRGCYGPDLAHLHSYAKAASTEEGFQRYLEDSILNAAAPV